MEPPRAAEHTYKFHAFDNGHAIPSLSATCGINNFTSTIAGYNKNNFIVISSVGRTVGYKTDPKNLASADRTFYATRDNPHSINMLRRVRGLDSNPAYGYRNDGIAARKQGKRAKAITPLPSSLDPEVEEEL